MVGVPVVRLAEVERVVDESGSLTGRAFGLRSEGVGEAQWFDVVCTPFLPVGVRASTGSRNSTMIRTPGMIWWTRSGVDGWNM